MEAAPGVLCMKTPLHYGKDSSSRSSHSFPLSAAPLASVSPCYGNAFKLTCKNNTLTLYLRKPACQCRSDKNAKGNQLLSGARLNRFQVLCQAKATKAKQRGLNCFFWSPDRKQWSTSSPLLLQALTSWNIYWRCFGCVMRNVSSRDPFDLVSSLFHARQLWGSRSLEGQDTKFIQGLSDLFQTDVIIAGTMAECAQITCKYKLCEF